MAGNGGAGWELGFGSLGMGMDLDIDIDLALLDRITAVYVIPEKHLRFGKPLTIEWLDS